jgi:hypothetical protein
MHLPGTLRIVATVAFALMGVAPASAQQPTRPATAPAASSPPPTTAASTPPLQDTVRITLPEASAGLLGDDPRSGRMLLLLLAENSPAAGALPMDAPFFDDPQPMYSVPVQELKPGVAVTIGADAIGFPGPIASLDGTFRAQAVFVRNHSERGHASPGNLASELMILTFARGKVDRLEIPLTVKLQAPARPQAPNLRWFEMKSATLSRAAGRDVVMRAGVALPDGWDDPNFRRRMFPAIYVVPGFGGRYTDAEAIARRLATPGSSTVLPQAVWIVLDPETPLGHHGFVDSAANGPWGTALVEEFIPALERQFRLIPRAEARIVTGHSSGGWSSLWLQLVYPEVFGACFSSSPDPVDFSRFQAGDLYADASVFCDAEGKERPSYRVPLVKQFDKVRMTVRDEAAMERVLGPARDSGEQWDAWSAMWSAVDPATRLPRPMFDSLTGTIDKGVVRNAWSRYDIAARVRADPMRHIPVLREKVRLLCGARDSFFLDRGVQGLKDAVAEASAAMEATGQMLPQGPGYIELVPEETHDTMAVSAMLRWNVEMREYLKANKLD